MRPGVVIVRIVESPTIVRLRRWWDGLSPRERVLVGTLAALLGFAVLVYGVVKPLQAIRAQAFADIRTYETLDARIRAAGTLGPSGPPQRTGAPADLVTQSATAAGLTIQTVPIEGGVAVTVPEGRYEAVVNWMAEIARTTGLVATRVEITRGAAPGLVAARVEYRG